MATIDEVRAFAQHCSNLLSDDEISRGLDAARHVSTTIHQTVESYDKSVWNRGMPDEYKAQVRTRLKQRLIDEVIGKGFLPVELPSVAEIDVTNGWGLVHIRASVRSRLA